MPLDSRLLTPVVEDNSWCPSVLAGLRLLAALRVREALRDGGDVVGESCGRREGVGGLGGGGQQRLLHHLQGVLGHHLQVTLEVPLRRVAASTPATRPEA